MTRYTNFARKRTYVDAGFDHANTNEEIAAAPTLEAPDNNASSSEPKKRKRVRSKKTTFEDSNAENPGGQEGGEGRAERPNKRSRMGDKHNSGKKFEKRPPKDSDWRKHASEQRRLKRIDDRNADTVCFACREKGHTARDCTNTLAADAPEGEQRRVKSGRDAVGICYRCGSRRHNLSKCKEPVDPSNPLPFASCFVCSGKGHLASKCPKNQSKGIYPNGGCCKLCKETTHLAKDCPLRAQNVQATTLFVGTGQAAGADEDDFHTFKRGTVEVDKAEKAETKAKRKAEVKVGAHSGVVKAFGSAPTEKKKKVVIF